MKKHGRFFFPDSDIHFQDNLGINGYYQEDTFNAAVKHCKETYWFVDIGAHVGMWTVKAAHHGFKHIIAYEPVLEHVECFIENTKELKARVDLYNIMLGNGGYGRMKQFITGNTGALQGEYSDKPKDGYTYQVHRIDDIFPGNIPIDLMKLDVEGAEKDILAGAKETLLRRKPVVVVEQKHNFDAMDFLRGIGMKLAETVRKDHVFIW